MARNEEKAQSMLYRFRQAKATEMGLISQNDRRPRIASSCKDLRQCERWRGEILREISRKVSKIQDYGLTDYEVRDLNDEINKLMREKSHWENQIIALGGANYKRAAPAMRNADGKEVPGMRGYKYFGRARELPGVKELFESAQQDQEELLSHRKQKYAAYENTGPDYFGDLGEEAEQAMLAAEREAEAEEWQDGIADVAEKFSVEADSLSLPAMPQADYISIAGPSTTPSIAQEHQFEIPPPPPDDSDEEEEPEEAPPPVSTSNKRKKTATKKKESVVKAAKTTNTQRNASSASANRILTVIREEDFSPAQVPSLEDLEKVLVQRQKQELMDEFF